MGPAFHFPLPCAARCRDAAAVLPRNGHKAHGAGRSPAEPNTNVPPERHARNASSPSIPRRVAESPGLAHCCTRAALTGA